MSNATFEERVKPEEVLEHYGVIGMKWGVHNKETQRKYGELKSPGQRQSPGENSKSSTKPQVPESKSITSRVKQRYGAYKELKAQQKADAEAKQKAAEEAAKKKAAEDAEIIRKYGVTREQHEAIRQATLRSNDPRVVIQGMKHLTDEELDAKIARLEKENKVKGLAVQQRKDAAAAAKAEREARQQTIPYRLGQLAVNSAKTQFLDPTLRAASNEVSKALRVSGEKALNALKNDSSVKQAAKETKDAAEKVKDGAAKVKLETEAAKIKAERDKIAAERARMESDREKQVKIAEGKALVDAIMREQNKSSTDEKK